MYPILFEFGFISVFSLWFFIAVGFVVGAAVFIHLAKRTRVRLMLLTEHSFMLFVWTLAVSRIFFIITHPDFYDFSVQGWFDMLAIWDKGFSFWAAVFAWVGGMYYVSRRSGEPIVRLLDIMTPALLIGLAFGNFGAFLDGVNYGAPSDGWWAVTFRSANVRYITPIHPTQLYAAAYALLTGLSLFSAAKKIRGALPGFIAELGLLIFSFFKFFEEFFRGDEAVKIFSLRLPQLLAFAAFCIALLLIRMRYINRWGGDPEGQLKQRWAKLKSHLPVRSNPGEKPSPSETEVTPSSLVKQHSTM